MNNQIEMHEDSAKAGEYKVGDGVTMRGWTDRRAGTVIKVARNGKEVHIQEDIAELAEGWKPEFIAGGFAGHCTNQSEQGYAYTRNPKGQVTVYTLRSKTFKAYSNRPATKRFYWVEKGGAVNGHNNLSEGRNKFHDYNF